MSAISNNLKMVATGRGKTMSMPKIVQEVLRLLPKGKDDDKFNLLYLGTATFDKDEPFHAQIKAYEKLPNCNIVRLDVSEAVNKNEMPTLDEMKKQVDDASVIFVSGGNTLSAMKRWESIGLDNLLKEAAHRTQHTPVLCGGSAGAIVWFSHGHSDSMDPTTVFRPDPNLTAEQKKDWKYIRVDGLRIVDADVLCVPHYDATQSNGRPRSDDSNNMLIRECSAESFVSLGIDEAAAIVIENGKVRCVTGEGSAHLHVLKNSGDGSILHKHIRGDDADQTWEHFVSFVGVE